MGGEGNLQIKGEIFADGVIYLRAEGENGTSQISDVWFCDAVQESDEQFEFPFLWYNIRQK